MVGGGTGRYNSTTDAALGWYDLFKYYDFFPPSGMGTTLTWTVQWNSITTGSSNANTSWNGQFFASSDKPYIRAM